MKTFLFVCGIFFCVICFSQPGKLNGTWYSANQDVLLIENDSTVYMENMFQRQEQFSKVVLKGSRLSIYRTYYSSPTRRYNKHGGDELRFTISGQTDSGFTITPVSTHAHKFFGAGTKQVQFIKKEYWVSEEVKFERIVFRSSDCFPSCPEVAAEIHADKKVRYRVSGFASPGETGCWSGRLPDSSYQQLLNLLRRCQLSTLRWNPVLCCDGVVYTLIIYTSQGRRYLKSMLPSLVSNDLIYFFNSLRDFAELKKVDEEFKFEN